MVELFNLIFVESPIGLSILLIGGIVCFGIMGYQADMKDTFSKRYDQDKKWREDRDYWLIIFGVTDLSAILIQHRIE